MFKYHAIFASLYCLPSYSRTLAIDVLNDLVAKNPSASFYDYERALGAHRWEIDRDIRENGAEVGTNGFGSYILEANGKL